MAPHPAQGKSDKGYGPSRRPILKKDILIAQAQTNSAIGAAQYLRVSYITYKKYSTMYGCFKKSDGNKRFPRKKIEGKFGLESILRGEHPGYDRGKLKKRLLAAGYLPNCCDLCGWDKARPVDDSVPLVMHYRDDNLQNTTLENLYVLCYNCTYCTTGRITERKLNIGYQEKDLADRGLTEDDIDQMQQELMQ